jgi:hypothetical protein
METFEKIVIIIMILVIAALFVAVSSYNPEAVHGAKGKGLKVIVRLSYSDYVSVGGTGVAYFRYYDDSGDAIKTKHFPTDEFPKSVTLRFPKGAVDINEYFTVCLNSYEYDEGECTSGYNHPEKKPEIVKLAFPS